MFSAIGLYDPGTTTRNAATTKAVPFVVCDCDLKNLVEGRDSALACLRELALPPSWIHDSGFGLRAGWELKEPLTTDEDMRRAEVVMQRLAVLLAGDPAPTNRASLYRVPGSHNTKEGGKRPCQVIEACGAGYDITELEDMLDLYGHPLLHYAPGRGRRATAMQPTVKRSISLRRCRPTVPSMSRRDWLRCVFRGLATAQFTQRNCR